MGTGPGPARLKLALDLEGMPGRPTASRRAPSLDLDTPQLKGIITHHREAGRRGNPRHRYRRAPAQRNRGRDRNCRPSRAAPCLPCWASIARSRLARARRNSKGTATGAWGAPLRLKAKISGDRPRRRSGRLRRTMGTGGQGESQPESSQRRSRAAARSQAGGYAGAEHRPVFARHARRQQADLRRSRQQHRRFAAARPPGADARRGEGDRRRNRPRSARAGAGLRAGAWRRRTRCGRAARRRAGEGLARQDRVSGVARRVAGRKRIAAGRAAWSRATASR